MHMNKTRKINAKENIERNLWNKQDKLKKTIQKNWKKIIRN